MATLKNTSINDTGYLGLPSGTTAQRPTSPSAGMVRWNTTTSTLEGYDGTDWQAFSFGGPLGTLTNPATSATAILNSGITTNGYYYIKPPGYTGDAFEVYCDLDGTASGITGTAGWHRVEYAQDYYSQASPFGNAGPGAITTEFNFNLSLAEIQALLDNASESRTNFVSYGLGSVGWTYQNYTAKSSRYIAPYPWFDGTLTDTSVGSADVDRWPSTSLNYSFTDINTFNNTGIDPTDLNDQVWRKGEIFIQDTTATYLPIRKLKLEDVDAANEFRYFPFVSQNSYTWIK